MACDPCNCGGGDCNNVTCYNLAFEATVSGSGTPDGIGIFLGPTCGPVGNECGNLASTCTEPISITGSISSGDSEPFYDDECRYQEIDLDESTESSSGTWECAICCGTTQSQFFNCNMWMTCESGVWTLEIQANMSLGFNMCHSLIGSCTFVQPTFGGDVFDNNQFFNLGANPVGSHTFNFTGDVTGFDYEVTFVVS